MKVLISILAITFCLVIGASQAPQNSMCDNRINLNVKVYQDPVIERLLCAHRDFTEIREGINGFRIQIFSDGGTQSRSRVLQRQRLFDQRHPNVRSYVTHEAPDFKLRVGNFRTRLDAQRFLNQISSTFPGAYIVIDLIDFPELEE